MRRLLHVLVLIIAVGVIAHADINFTFDNPNQVGLPGDTLHFFGTIVNNGPDTVFLNADSINFTNAASFTLNDLFFTNVPISLGSGLSSGDIELFSVSLANPFTNSFHLYPGTYTLTGGADSSAQDVLASAHFSVRAQPAFSVPEPSTITLLVALGAALCILARTGRLRFG